MGGEYQRVIIFSAPSTLAECRYNNVKLFLSPSSDPFFNIGPNVDEMKQNEK